MNTLQNKSISTASVAATEDFAAGIAAEVKPGTVIALHGNLGAGKTVFSRGFARGLNITEPVSSPTYTIIQEYPLEQGGWLFHLDLYRIEDENAALAFGVDEYLDDSEAFVLIEWPERIADLLPEDTLHIQIVHTGDETRDIVMS
ncbi:tRNA (adenosine(37)-N6)-threonylcarbamoyltransferase complex ATPase subunit type 1 TsaE [Lentisphaerota bacterium ZTH]|nr:tRNA (adenosine(37)-N6)-threonylcarbamoyltransferase complex ATPase subunit type 1 TsaE [Lentisphaerota bacterium]WET06902.1 tRNA (adenosine(37)-N6)-threonylcarbamoyltransferase complex ATPase subunit type 1 TsaE [Lentisphaerota bacterium ZTH]